jgi:uncharacterized protein
MARMQADRRTESGTRAEISRFLGLSRFAAVGLSKKPQDFTRKLMGCLVESGYEVVPVNPTVKEIDGRECFATVRDVRPPVTAALLLTSPAATEQVVRDCAASGVSLIWMYRASGAGAVSEVAVQYCHEHGMSVIAGECPLMFLPHTGFVHRVHGFFRRIAGTYPR